MSIKSQANIKHLELKIEYENISGSLSLNHKSEDKRFKLSL